MVNGNKNKALAVAAVVLLAAYAVYYFFFRVKSYSEIAGELGLYTGEVEHDACLNDMMATASATTGTNLEWELNEAARWLTAPPPTSEDYWRVNGVFTPAGALLVTMDSTFDFNQANGTPQAYTQNMISQLWGRFNAYKHLMENPEGFSTGSGLNTDLDIPIQLQPKF